MLSNPPIELVEVLHQAISISELTGGAFDVTVKPLVDLYQQTQPDLPGEDAVGEALAFVNYRKLSVPSAQVSLAPGMAITLDGIAKGYIVDAGVAQLRKLGYENVFVEAGGDLMAAGTKQNQIPWRVGVQSPREALSGILGSFEVKNQAVATSGDYMNYFTEDMAHHHIIDPRVGISPTELASVTVIAPTATLADSLATAVMVMGYQGLQIVEDLSACEAYVITKFLESDKTSGFQLN
jgi:thiamine biosynthesis lipoprotein